jgi:hypothetical protein
MPVTEILSVFKTQIMKLKSTLFLSVAIATLLIATGQTTYAQQYKLKQTTSMSGMKSETTIYVKGSRKRTEGGGFMGQGANLVTIEQCDLQRTIRINEKKKLYIIEPFSKDEEETDEDAKPAKTKPVAAAAKQPKETTKQIGGVIYTTYNITDTGERKKMYGFTARHVWTTQKINPSADACMMKDSMVIKTDGWYIDLPQFNCPVNRMGRSGMNGGGVQPTCTDRYVSKRSGKGKLGFPLIETKTMIMGGTMQTSEFKTQLETLELSTMKLDSMLFEIPPGYKEAEDEEELQDKMDMSQMMKQASYTNQDYAKDKPLLTEQKTAGKTRIAVYEPKGGEQLQASLLQQHLVNTLTDGNIEAVAVASKEEAKKFNCDLQLITDFTKVKQGSKVGSLLKAIKNTDPGATSSFNIDANLTLSNLSDGTTRTEQKVSGKFDGKMDEAAKKALEKGCNQVLKEIQ